MPETISIYNHTLKLLLNREVNPANLRLMLLDDSATFTATHTAISSIEGDEVTGGGVAAGGIAISGAAFTTVSTSGAMLDATDISATATGSDIGPAHAAVIYETDTDKPLAFIGFDGAKTADEGTDFKVLWHGNGILRAALA